MGERGGEMGATGELDQSGRQTSSICDAQKNREEPITAGNWPASELNAGLFNSTPSTRTDRKISDRARLTDY